MTPLYSLPTHFIPDEIPAVLALNATATHGRVAEVFGGPSPDPFGSGRSSDSLPRASIAQVAAFAAECAANGIRFNYVMNAACLGGAEFTKDGRRRLTTMMETLAKSGIVSITLAIPTLIEFVARNFPEIKVVASVILRVDSAAKARQVEDLGASRIILFEDLSRNFQVLDTIRRSCTADLEIMVNSPCTFGCLFREMHYNLLSHSHQPGGCGSSFEHWCTRCGIETYENPAEALRARGLIRPEDIHLYTERGIEYFKVVGRESDKGNIHAVTKPYLDGHHEGNVFDLFARAPNTMHVLEMDNRKLDGFLEPFIDGRLTCATGCHFCGYCDKAAENIGVRIPPEQVKRIVAEFKATSPLKPEH